MKIPQVQYLSFKSKRNFGIELEVNQKIPAKELVKIVSSVDPETAVMQSNHYEQDYNNDYWHVKFDRSCGDKEGSGGWEVASYKANGYKDIENMGKVTDALKKAGAAINDECGFHIHVETADFTHPRMSCLVANWIKIEPIILEMLPKHRRNNKYAKPFAKRFDVNRLQKLDSFIVERFWDVIRPQRYDHPNRRVSLNLCNYSQWDRKTIELRLPEGTLESKDVKNWIRFLVNFVDGAKKSLFPKNLNESDLFEFLRISNLHSDDPFYILSKGMKETKMWVAKRILKYSDKESLREDANKLLEVLEVKKVKEELIFDFDDFFSIWS